MGRGDEENALVGYGAEKEHGGARSGADRPE